jgi:hypothetical protein
MAKKKIQGLSGRIRLLSYLKIILFQSKQSKEFLINMKSLLEAADLPSYDGVMKPKTEST